MPMSMFVGTDIPQLLVLLQEELPDQRLYERGCPAGSDQTPGRAREEGRGDSSTMGGAVWCCARVTREAGIPGAGGECLY